MVMSLDDFLSKETSERYMERIFQKNYLPYFPSSL